MKCGFLGAIAFLLTGASWVAAQAPPTSLPTPSAQPARTMPPAGGVVYPTTGDTQGGTVNNPTGQPPLADGPGVVPAEAFAPVAGGPVFYADADFLLYRFRQTSIPTAAQTVPVGLISVNTTNLTEPTPTGPVTPASPTTFGFVPVSIVNNAMFGSGRVDYASQTGARIALGFWMDREETWGLELRAEAVERGTATFAALGGTSPNQFVINTGFTQTLFLVNAGPPVTQTAVSSFPLIVVRQTSSSATGSASNDFYDGELNARGVFLRIGCVDFGGLAGFRYLRYEEELALDTTNRLFRPAGFPITTGDATGSLSNDLSFTTHDRNRVYSNFYGAQTGLEINMKFGSFFLDTRGTLALGDMHQVADIAGSTSVVNNDPAHPTPATALSNGGLLSGPTDIGGHSRDRFAYVPEVNARFGCQLTSWFRCWVGYDALVIGHAASAAGASTTNSLATTVTVAGSTNNVNIAQPQFRFSDRDVSVQGLTFGAEVRY